MGTRVKHQTSTGISTQLYRGEDDDLIEWWNNLHYGQGGEEIKRALRAYIGGRPAGGGTQIPVAMLESEALPAGSLSERQASERRDHMLSRKW